MSARFRHESEDPEPPPPQHIPKILKLHHLLKRVIPLDQTHPSLSTISHHNLYYFKIFQSSPAAAVDREWFVGLERGCWKMYLEWKIDCHRNHVCRKIRLLLCCPDEQTTITFIC